jgi:hypothetical protein
MNKHIEDLKRRLIETAKRAVKEEIAAKLAPVERPAKDIIELLDEEFSDKQGIDKISCLLYAAVQVAHRDGIVEEANLHNLISFFTLVR